MGPTVLILLLKKEKEEQEQMYAHVKTVVCMSSTIYGLKFELYI